MKLEKLIISNFRGLKGNLNKIDFSKSDIIFLIGQNNVGKSTYLHAYEFFVNPKQNATREDFYNYDTSIPIQIEGWFLKEDADNDEEDFKGKGKSADPDWADKWVGEDGFIKIRKTWNTLGPFKKETFSPKDKNWVENGFGGFDSLFSKYAPQPIAINAMEDEGSLGEKVNKLIQDSFLKKIKDDYSEDYQKAIAAVKDLQEKITNSDAVEKWNKELNTHFKEAFAELTLKIQATKEENIKIEDAIKKNHTISIEKDSGTGRKETFLQNGHGVIRQALFNFIAFLQENADSTRKEYLILFEEPELFLHPKITFKLRESLYKLAENSPYQILCATHSPMMIDISKPHSSLIRATKDSNENTRTYQVGEDVFSKDEERRQQVQMINRFNPHICEAFYADNVILVEGDTETIVYRDLLNKYYPNKEVFVLNTGSKNNFPFFQEILTAFHIKHCAIHDTDTEYNAKGKHNSAWTLNQKIWDLVNKANGEEVGLARRYVHIANFENAHKYHLLHGADKPLQAYKFAKTITRDNLPDCLKWLDDFLGEQKILHDMEYINSNKKNIDQIKEEEKNYISLVDDN